MSTALVLSLEELLLTAMMRLTAELKTETDPARLETLLALAFRARIPRTPIASDPAPSHPAPSNPDRPTPRTNDATPRATTPGTRASAGAPAPSTPTSTHSADAPEADDDDDGYEYPPMHFAEMTQEEFIKLEREIGYTEANRRRIIRADLARRHPFPQPLPTPNTS